MKPVAHRKRSPFQDVALDLRCRKNHHTLSTGGKKMKKKNVFLLEKENKPTTKQRELSI